MVKARITLMDVLKLFLQAVGLSAVVVIYFVVRAIRMKRRKTKK